VRWHLFIMIECKDNLEFMSKLQSESVDLIYCDILYGTGKHFGDYQDLKPIKSIIEEHYIPRLKEMHRLLKPTGSIYLQMDYKISHWLRCIADDIFGYDKFLNEIIWYYKRWSAKSNKFQTMHDNILFYRKGSEHKFNSIYVKPANEEKGVKENYKKDIDGRMFRWQSNKGNKYKIYRDEKGVLCGDVWEISTLHASAKERVGYATQKPKELIKRIIEASSNENDVVADFYLGCGTTALVCKELNRKFIGCDINPKAIELTNKRLNETLL
jgi:DNA modification methylase